MREPGVVRCLLLRLTSWQRLHRNRSSVNAMHDLKMARAVVECEVCGDVLDRFSYDRGSADETLRAVRRAASLVRGCRGYRRTLDA